MSPNKNIVGESNMEEIMKTNIEESSNVEESQADKVEIQHDQRQTDKDINLNNNLEDYKECSICLEPIITGKRLHCGHVNHLKCLK